MDIHEAIFARHSVRSYLDRPIEREIVVQLQTIINEINAESGLHIQLKTNEPGGFSGIMAHYGSFSGVQNYIVMAGPGNADRAIGYYGEKLVLAAQMLGLNTCWVALTFNKRKAVYDLADGEKLHLVISLGYGATQGQPHRSKAPAAVSNLTDSSPDWFKRGIEYALLAPTAVNQQKFSFTLSDDRVIVKAGSGFYTEIDLGIAMYHFDIGSGKTNFEFRG